MITKTLHLSLYKYNNVLSTTRFVVSVLMCMGYLAFSTQVHAEGVLAGTNITNIATVSYKVNNIDQSPIESSPNGNTTSGLGNGQGTEFIVDRKVDLLVTGNSNADVTPGEPQSEVTFSLQNQGNDVQEFSLLLDNLLATDDFDSSNCNIQITGVSGTPLFGVVLPTSGNIKLSPDQQASISVRCDIPFDNAGTPIVSGQTALVGLIAEAEKNGDNSDTVSTEGSDTANGIETVFADDTGTDDSNRDAMHSARRTYTASSSTTVPTLTMDKTIVSVVDTSGGNTAVAGSLVTYNIKINTSGMGIINNLVIADPTPAEMSYKVASIKLNNSNQSDANDSADNTDFGITTANTATINLGDIVAGSQYDIQLTYIIN